MEIADSMRPDGAQGPHTEAARAADLELNSLYELNRDAIEALVEAARSDAPHSPFGFVSLLRNPLKSLDPAARQAAAQCPFLLVDFRFQDDEWWRTVKRHPTRAPREADALECFARARAVGLARSALTLAWHMTRARPEATPLLLAMSRGCAETIATLSLSELERIAHQQSRFLRPRWEERPIVWQSLLTAARRADVEALQAFRLHGVQRIVRELLHRSGTR